MVKKAFLKGCSFVIILLLITMALNSVFIVKTNHREKLLGGIYGNTEDKLDVVLLGSSHMNSGISPNVLWNQYGITSFNYATGGQPIDVTYYILKDVLKYHENPIVVVDLYYLGLTDKFGADGYVRNALDSIKFSFNKLDAIINCTPRNQWLNYLFPIFKYHDRWKELTKNDFEFNPLSAYYEKGFDAGIAEYGEENTSDTSITGTVDLVPKSEEYLNKIIDLSKKEGFKLIFTATPHDYNSTATLDHWVEEPAKMFNKIEEISKENNIPFINYNKITEELGFDFKSDMFNTGHLNVFGAEKITLSLGEFLKENYTLTDHSTDVEFEKWESDYIRYSKAEATKILTTEADIKKYISLLKNKDYIVVVSSNEAGISNNEYLKASLTQLGLKFDKINSSDSNYLAVIDDNKVKSQIFSSSKLSVELLLDKDNKLKVTTKSDDKNIPSMILNGTEHLNKHKGINIVVYDKVSKGVLDNVYLDSNNKITR